MELKEPKTRLTNENLNKKFKSQFDLVNYAIKLAENMIHTGRESRVKTEMQNRAMQILEEIAHGKDQFDEVLKTPAVEPATETHSPKKDFKNGKSKKESMSKMSNPKTTRKIL